MNIQFYLIVCIMSYIVLFEPVPLDFIHYIHLYFTSVFFNYDTDHLKKK